MRKSSITNCMGRNAHELSVIISRILPVLYCAFQSTFSCGGATLRCCEAISKNPVLKSIRPPTRHAFIRWRLELREV